VARYSAITERRRTVNARTAAAAAGAILTLAAALGCSGQGTGHYVPPEPASRKALESALDAWKDGKLSAGKGGEPAGKVPDSSPSVFFVDSRRKRAQQLENYEVVKEESEGGNTFFSVKLTLKGPRAEEVVRYVVVGVDPLWVYREEDFKSGAGM
jgi:hypothetical protein